MTEQASLDAPAWKAMETRLRTYVRRRVDPDAVDDVVATILLRLVRHKDELGAARTPTAWMLRVASNAIADYHRRRATEARALARAALEPQSEIASEREDVDSASADIAHCLVPMIKDLPALYAEALTLVDLEGVSQAEAARRLGLSASGMKSRVQRARAKLKDALLRCCTFELDRRGSIIDYAPRLIETRNN